MRGIKVEPELPQKRGIKNIFKEAKEKADLKVYDKIIVLIDLDKVISDNQIKIFEKELKRTKRYKEILVLINNPCLELWFLIHYKYTTKMFSDCDRVINSLRKYLNDYRKDRKYYTARDNDIYKRLRPFLNTAIKNGEKLGDFNSKNPFSSKAEIYKIFRIVFGGKKQV